MKSLGLLPIIDAKGGGGNLPKIQNGGDKQTQGQTTRGEIFFFEILDAGN